MQRSVDYRGGSLLRGMNIKPSFTDPDISAYKNKHTRRGHTLRMCRSNSTVHPPAGDFQRDNCDGLTRLGENLIESLSLLMFKSSTFNRRSVFSLCFSVWSAQNNPGTWKLIPINVAVAGSWAVTVLCAFFFFYFLQPCFWCIIHQWIQGIESLRGCMNDAPGRVRWDLLFSSEIRMKLSERRSHTRARVPLRYCDRCVIYALAPESALSSSFGWPWPQGHC